MPQFVLCPRPSTGSLSVTSGSWCQWRRPPAQPEAAATSCDLESGWAKGSESTASAGRGGRGGVGDGHRRPLATGLWPTATLVRRTATAWLLFALCANVAQSSWIQHDGASWTSLRPVWPMRFGHCSELLSNGTIVVLGGSASPTVFHADVWSTSDDAATWTQVLQTAPWSARELQACVVLPDDSILVMGGMGVSSIYMNDVWRGTSGGVHWTRLTNNAPWDRRSSHVALRLSSGVLVLMGGTNRDGGLFNDVWHSNNDGVTWTSVQVASSVWSPRRLHSAVLLTGDVILLSAGYRFSTLRDVWRSSDAGRTWEHVTASVDPTWGARAGHSMVVLSDGSVLLTGGWPEIADAWRSIDGGETWHQVAPSGSVPWRARYRHRVVVHGHVVVLTGGKSQQQSYGDLWRSVDGGVSWSPASVPNRVLFGVTSLSTGQLVMMGGMGANSLKLADVWQSMDIGRTWQLLTPAAPWPGRHVLSMATLPDDRIVLLGGSGAGHARLNDVWVSPTGGRTWTLVLSNAPWTARMGHGAVCTRDGTIVIAGGLGFHGQFADVWTSSTAGSTWQLVVSSAPFGTRIYFSMLVVEDSIVLFGGAAWSDVWRSGNKGVSWTRVTASAPWAVRSRHASALLAGSVLVLMGGLGPSNNVLTDIWASSDGGATWQWVTSSPPWASTLDMLAAPVVDGHALLVMGGSSNTGTSPFLLPVWLAACAVGQYATGTSCTACSAGFVSNLVPAASSSACTPCSGGQYSPAAGRTACDTCLAGTVSNSASAATGCVACPAGTYSSYAGRTTCTPCPAGTASASIGLKSVSACTFCSPGTFSIAGSASCQLCPAGTYFSDSGATSSSQCVPCHQGTYGPSAGAARCQSCPPGTFSSVTGSISNVDCTPCPVGTYSRAFFDVETGLDFVSCEPCPAGTFGPTVGAMTCRPCPVGHYSTATGATSLSTCIACPAGSFSTAKGASSSAACHYCGAGTFAELPGSIACLACSAGTYLAVDGATNASACTPCPAGRTATVPGASTAAACERCPAGTYFSTTAVGQSTCAPCPAGTSNPSTGGESTDSCVPCAAGTFSAEQGSISCTMCPAGTFSPTVGAASASSCVPCPAGKFGTATGAKTLASCSDCPSGSFNEVHGSTSCVLCPRGTASLQVGAEARSTCQMCTAGTYAGEAGSMQCALCPTGTHSLRIGAVSVTECSLCMPGSYAEVPGQSDCHPCPSGTFNNAPGARNASACMPCPYGTHSAIEGAAGCPLCPKPETCLGGYVCRTGSVGFLCGECAAGYYPLSGTCRKCPRVSVVSLVLGGISFLALVSLMRLGYINVRVLAMLSILVSYVQLQHLTFSLHVAWPVFIMTVWRWFRIMVADLGLMSPHCVAIMNWHKSLAITLALAIMFPFLMWAAAKLLVRAQRIAKFMGKNESDWADLMNAAVAFSSSTVYIPVLRTLLQAFDCASTPKGWVLRLDVTIDCLSGVHIAVMIGSCLLVGLLIAFPAALTFKLAKALRGSSSEEEVDLVMKSVCCANPWLTAAVRSSSKTYKHKYRHMYFITQLYKGLMVILAASFRSGLGQSLALLLISVPYLALLVRWHPFAATATGSAWNIISFKCFSVKDLLNKSVILAAVVQVVSLVVAILLAVGLNGVPLEAIARAYTALAIVVGIILGAIELIFVFRKAPRAPAGPGGDIGVGIELPAAKQHTPAPTPDRTAAGGQPPATINNARPHGGQRVAAASNPHNAEITDRISFARV